MIDEGNARRKLAKRVGWNCKSSLYESCYHHASNSTNKKKPDKSFMEEKRNLVMMTDVENFGEESQYIPLFIEPFCNMTIHIKIYIIMIYRRHVTHSHHHKCENTSKLLHSAKHPFCSLSQTVPISDFVNVP